MCVCVCVCVWYRMGCGEICRSARPPLQGRRSPLYDPMACAAIVRHGPILLCRRHVATWQYSGREKSQLRVGNMNTFGFTELWWCVVRPWAVPMWLTPTRGVLLEQPTGRSDRQEIPHILWNCRVLYPHYNSQIYVPIQSQMNPIHTVYPMSNITIQPTCKEFQNVFASRFPIRRPPAFLLHMDPRCHPSHPPSDCPNT